MNKILSNVVIHKDYSKDIVRVLRSSKSDELTAGSYLNITRMI